MVSSGLGFIATINSYSILIASSMGTVADSPIFAEIVAINFALDLCFSRS